MVLCSAVPLRRGYHALLAIMSMPACLSVQQQVFFMVLQDSPEPSNDERVSPSHQQAGHADVARQSSKHVAAAKEAKQVC